MKYHKLVKLIKKEAETINRIYHGPNPILHASSSAMDIYIKNVYSTTAINSHQQIEFMIVFLEIDPIFFRSGYIKEEILRKVMRYSLTKAHIDRLIIVLINAVKHCGRREFRKYCRLAIQVANDTLIAELERHKKMDNDIKSRANMMLSYVYKHS